MSENNQTNARPNIIWIMADDMSWGDLGCFGSELIETPNIDRLATEGMRFTCCYSGSTVCAPSRSSLMQGLHQGHATVRNNAAPGGYRHCLQPEDTTVAEVLSGAGYRCGLFGKWGLSLWDQPTVPTNKGFDSFCGYLNQRRAHNYYPPYLWRDTDRIWFPQHEGHDHSQPNEYDADGNIIPNGMAEPGAARYSFDVYTEASEEWLRADAEQPFFLYLAYTTPHQAFEVPSLQPYADRDWPTTHKAYAAMVTRTDAAVGRVMAILEEQGRADNTLVIFTSDNGYSHKGVGGDITFDDRFNHHGPLKGEKGNLNQGGLRVPTIAHWPAVLEGGRTCNHPWAYWDLMPTAAELSGAECPRTDGTSIVPLLTNHSTEYAHRDYFYWEHGNAQAVRMEQWWATRPHPDKPLELYEADADPMQERDLAKAMPDIAARVEEIMVEAREPNIYFPAPGQPHDEWQAELDRRGIELPVNVDV